MRITRSQGNIIIVITRMSFNLMLKEHEKHHKGFYKLINVLLFQNEFHSLNESTIDKRMDPFKSKKYIKYNNNVTWFTLFLLSYCLFKSNLKSLLRKSWELFILIYNSLYVAMTKTIRIYAAGMLNDLYLHWLKYIHKFEPVHYVFIYNYSN